MENYVKSFNQLLESQGASISHKLRDELTDAWAGEYYLAFFDNFPDIKTMIATLKKDHKAWAKKSFKGSTIKISKAVPDEWGMNKKVPLFTMTITNPGVDRTKFPSMKNVANSLGYAAYFRKKYNIKSNHVIPDVIKFTAVDPETDGEQWIEFGIYLDNSENMFIRLAVDSDPTSPKVKKLVKGLAGVDDKLDDILSDLKYFKPGDSFQSQSGKDSKNKRAYIEFRHLGNWYTPDWDDEEDPDQEEWAGGEYQKYLKIFKSWAKPYKWAKGAKLDVNTSEKNWAEFSVTVK